MKAYKGFNKDMTCRDFKFEIGKEYAHEGKVECCKSGFHACEHPLDCLGYNPPSQSVYHEVELNGEIATDKESNDTKVAAEKIKIGARLDISGLVKAAVNFTFERAKKVKGNTVKLPQGAASATGDYGAASATGSQGAASATGYYGAASATGSQGAASATGSQGAASATGSQGAASATGDYGAASATGYYGAASATGYKGAASALNSTAVAVAWGKDGKARGIKGAHIVLAEWGDWNGKEYPFICAKMAMVDGEKIKENTFYTLKNGEFVEVLE